MQIIWGKTQTIYMKKSIIVINLLLCFALASCSKSVNSDLNTGPSLPNNEDLIGIDYTADRANLKVQIVGDGSIPPYKFDGLQPYFDNTGATMFPMTHFEELFKGKVSYEISNNNLTITKNVLDAITVVSVTTDSNILILDEKEIVMNTTPVQKDGTIYIPLEFVGRALSYGVYWNDRLEEVKFYQYTSVYIYLWNKNEDSSSSGLRYSYIISGDRNVDVSKITSNALSDFKKIRETLK